MTDKPDYVIAPLHVLLRQKHLPLGESRTPSICAMQPPRLSAYAKPSAPSARRSSKHLVVACDGFEARRHLTASGCYQTVDAYGRVCTRCRSRVGSPRNALLNGQAGRESV
jgi:hypothetical protein